MPDEKRFTRKELLDAMFGEPDEDDPALASMRRIFERQGEGDGERERITARIDAAYGYDADTEGMDPEAAARFQAFKGPIDRVFDRGGEPQ